ncbi:Elsinochromes biosynthesis cluster protein HP1 [Metarhizium brunneum]|uniref:Elsinochromes biosynthesis cluster protein HP1 n=1 Tax=Metarhizium brunneum TaxID=500148 RepID=A0A7D5UTE4_9HYPO|nr:Elsinochromes biosynthesis cluster protein HP1 [Metarhizium brunneum]
MAKCSYTCGADVVPLEPYGDISGLGVLLGFTIMAWVSVVLVLLYYVLAFDAGVSPFANKRGSGPSSSPSTNPVDAIVFQVFRILRSRLGLKPERHLQLESTFNRCILMLADTQLITGIAIMVSGYYSLTCGLSAYHWQTVLYLAWFSCLTHLSALTCLRAHLHAHPTARTGRLLLMTALLALLFVGFVPTGHFDFRDHQLPEKFSDSAPAVCYFKGGMDRDGTPFASMVLTLLLLAYGYLVRVAKLFESSSTVLSRFSRRLLDRNHDKFLNAWARGLQNMRPSVALCVAGAFIPLQTSLYFALRILLDLYASMLSEVSSLVLSASWASTRLANLRRSGDVGDNDWTFGQVISLVLLAGPALSIAQLMYSCCLSPGQDRTQEDGNISAETCIQGDMVQGPELAPCQPPPGECALAGVEIIPLEESHSSLPGDRNRSLADHSSTSILVRAATPAGNVEETRVEPPASHHYQILQSPGHVEQLQPRSDIDAEVIRILHLGRNAYPGLLGFADILIPSAPLLYFFASILAGVDFVVLLTHQILYFFILLPVFSQAFIICAFFLKLCRVRRQVEAVLRCGLGVGLAVSAINALRWGPPFYILLGLLVGSLLGLQIIAFLSWAVFRLCSLRQHCPQGLAASS